ncbi:hypothetical protein KKB28_05390, partial [bacterium]|nr:hypothetical protein [bacterium]
PVQEWLKLFCVFSFVVVLAFLSGCDKKKDEQPENSVWHPECIKSPHERTDAHSPETMVSDWGQPVRLGTPINTPCPEDACEISRDGQYLYFYFTIDLFENLLPEEIFSYLNGTYVAQRIGGPADFSEPVFYDLGKGANESLDGELSFTPDGSKVYFHSTRAANLGYLQDPPVDDFLDIYVADITNGEPGPGRNLGTPVNSIYPDGEHAIHPDGVTLYFSSHRPGGVGSVDIWISTLEDSTWSDPVALGEPINSTANDLQPTFTSDGDTMYFVSDRNIAVGAAIYRSNRVGDVWSEPELVIKGIVGEPSITANGEYLYFVHVLTDISGTFDADIWYCERVR